MLDELTQKVRRKEEVSAIELEQLVRDLADPEIDVQKKAEFLTAFHEKPEMPREIADLAATLRGLAIDPRVEIKMLGGLLIDTCGTGGDRMDTFNASTAASFILAAAGLPVAKHGNRAITSKCGSADVLEALGVQIETPPESVQRTLQETRFAFLYAPEYHKIFKTIQPLRQYLAQKGQRTVFNILGPLLNPARPNIQVVGVFSSRLTEKMGAVLKLMGLLRAVVVHGFTDEKKEAGLDEFSNLGPNQLTQLHSSGTLETIELDISVVGLTPGKLEELKGGDKEANAKIIRGVLKGEIGGSARDFVLFNASAGLVLGKLAKDLKEGIEKAAAEIDSGRAWNKLEQVREFSHQFSKARTEPAAQAVRVKVDTDWIRLQKEKQEKKLAEGAQSPTRVDLPVRAPQPTQLLKPKTEKFQMPPSQPGSKTDVMQSPIPPEEEPDGEESDEEE